MRNTVTDVALILLALILLIGYYLDVSLNKTNITKHLGKYNYYSFHFC